MKPNKLRAALAIEQAVTKLNEAVLELDRSSGAPCPSCGIAKKHAWGENHIAEVLEATVERLYKLQTKLEETP